MDTILTGNIWKRAASQTKAAKRRLVAVAYVSSDQHLKLKRDDVLICDASNRAIKAGETSAKVLRTLLDKHVELRSYPNLHAKVAVFGRYAVIGSSNLSVSSAEVLTELALLTDRKQVVSQAAAFIHDLREHSKEINDDFVQRIAKLKVQPRKPRGKKRMGQAKSFGSSVWLVNVQELAEDRYPDEQPYVEKGEERARAKVADEDATISWIRWTGKSRFRSTAREGDMVIQIWKSLSGKRVSVFSPCPIVLCQNVAHWTRFYVSESEDCTSLPWGRFEKETKKLGLKRISKGSVRELNAREALLIESLWK